MNPLILKFAKLMSTRPTDSTIRILHVVSGLVIMELLWFSGNRSILDIPFIGPQKHAIENMIQLWLLLLGVPFVIKGLLPFCLVKHRTLRIIQASLGFLIIIVGGPIMDPMIKTITVPAQKGAKTVNIDVGPTITKSSHPGIILVLLGALWFFVGLTGKGTTEKCLRYKEVVKKIRV